MQEEEMPVEEQEGILIKLFSDSNSWEILFKHLPTLREWLDKKGIYAEAEHEYPSNSPMLVCEEKDNQEQTLFWAILPHPILSNGYQLALIKLSVSESPGKTSLALEYCELPEVLKETGLTIMQMAAQLHNSVNQILAVVSKDLGNLTQFSWHIAGERQRLGDKL